MNLDCYSFCTFQQTNETSNAMANHMLNPLEDCRPGTARMLQATNISENTENNCERYCLSSGSFSNSPQQLHGYQFDVSKTSDKGAAKTIHPEKHGTWNLNTVPGENGVDPNMGRLSPLSKALAMASNENISNFNDEYFDSVQQSIKTHSVPNNTKEEHYNESMPEASKVCEAPANPISDKKKDCSLKPEGNSLTNSQAKEDSSQGGINSKVNSNLAGIVISSGPGGHFETFEGKGDTTDSLSVNYPHPLMHAPNTTTPFQDEIKINLLRQQYRDSVAPNLSPTIGCETPFDSSELVSTLNFDTSNLDIESRFNDNPAPYYTAIHDAYPDLFSELFDQQKDIGTLGIDIKASTSKISFPTETLMNEHVNSNAITFNETNNDTFNDNLDGFPALRNDEMQFLPNAPSTTHKNDTNKTKTPLIVTFNKSPRRNFHDTEYISSIDRKISSTTKTPLRIKRRFLNSKSNRSKTSTKTPFQKSLLKSKNQCNYYTGDDTLTQKPLLTNTENAVDTNSNLPTIPIMNSLVSTSSSNQNHVANDDKHGKYRSRENSRGLSIDMRFDIMKYHRRFFFN